MGSHKKSLSEIINADINKQEKERLIKEAEKISVKQAESDLSDLLNHIIDAHKNLDASINELKTGTEEINKSLADLIKHLTAMTERISNLEKINDKLNKI